MRRITQESEQAFREMVTDGGKLAELLQAFRVFLGQNDMMAYLVMMATRLVEMKRVMKQSGTIFLHCDNTASHYLKLLMDGIFGIDNYRNEIVWKRTHGHGNVSRNFGSIYDNIVFYSRSNDYVWNKQYLPFPDDYVRRKFNYRDADGRIWQSVTLRNPSSRPNLYYPYTASNGVTYQPHPNGWSCDIERMRKYDKENRLHYPSKQGGQLRLKMYLDEMPGIQMQNLWEDIYPINSQAQERLGYPTQKPEALLERVIKATSNEGDIVLDPFCGCGTAIAVAERLKRRWIGIDITHLAISLIKNRLGTAFGEQLSPYEVYGVPTDLEGTKALAEQDRYKYESWALDLVDAHPFKGKKGADTGVDGIIQFFDDTSGKAKKAIVQIKSGHVSSAHIRDLKGAREREKADIALFVTLHEPTKAMLIEAASGGFYEPKFFPNERVPRIQILTIKELLEGKKAQYPRVAPNVTYKNAPKQRKAGGAQQLSLVAEGDES